MNLGLIPNQNVHNIALANCNKLYDLMLLQNYSAIDIVAHSWGTTITYDMAQVNTWRNWVTMGSPLRWNTQRPGLKGKWLNIYSVSDPVCTLNIYPRENIGQPRIQVVPDPFEILYPGAKFNALNEVIRFNAGFDEHTQYWNHKDTILKMFRLL